MNAGSAAPPLLSVRHASKAYDGEAALRDVSLELVAGEVHALMGENGAGKSTLIKLLAGVETADRLELLLDGRSVTLRGSADAARLGFRFIHQELNVVPALSVAENVLLGHAYPRTRFGTVAWRGLRQRAATALRDLGVTHIDVAVPMSRLGTGDAMLASIARALVEPPGGGSIGRLYVMDEPTAALSRHETELLFAVVRRLRERGACVLYVSHRMEEIFELADRVTVLRDGRWVCTVAASEASRDRLILAMTGRTMRSAPPPRTSADGAISAEALPRRASPGRASPRRASPRRAPPIDVSPADASLPDATPPNATAPNATPSRRARGHRRGGVAGEHPPALQVTGLRSAHLQDVTFTLEAGEVVGLVGLSGSGRSALMRALMTADRVWGGNVRLRGGDVRLRHPAAAWRSGLAYVPEERRSQGLAMNADVRRNLLLPHLRRVAQGGIVNRRRERRETERWASAVGLRSRGPRQVVHELSGGNQQKVVLARALAAEPEVLLLDEPTRGVDVGAKADIYALVRATAARGAAVLLTSSDLDEILDLCDRVLVLHAGAIAYERDTAQLDRASLLELCYGGAAA